MSWLELDDGILDHPKFVLAADKGGSAAIHMWLGLRAYCGKQLTDGSIPKFMLKKVSGPEKQKDREHALAVLLEVNLVEDHGDFYQLHDYLEHSKSRETILEARKRNKARQAKWRGDHPVSNGVTDSVTNALVAPSVTEPSPLLSSPLHSKIPLTPSVLPPQGGGDRDISREDLESFSVDIVIADGTAPGKAAKKPRKKPSTPFPDGLVPLPRQLEKCRELQLNCAEEFEKFSARHQSTGALFADWHRAFDTWISRAPEFRRPVGGAIVSRFQQPVSANVDFETKQRLAASRRYAEFVGGAK